MARKLAPMHPGEVLREEFLVPLGLSAGALAKACGVPRTRIERIANEETAITADTALRLGKALGTSAQLWLNLQNEFDMRTAKSQIGKQAGEDHADHGTRRRLKTKSGMLGLSSAGRLHGLEHQHCPSTDQFVFALWVDEVIGDSP